MYVFQSAPSSTKTHPHTLILFHKRSINGWNPAKQTLCVDPKVLEESLGTGFRSVVTLHEKTGSVTASAIQLSAGAIFASVGIN